MEYRELLRPELPEKLKKDAQGIIIAQAKRGALHPVVADLVEILTSGDPKNHELRRKTFIANEGGALAAVSNKRMLDTLEVIGGLFEVDHFSEAISAMYCSSAGVANGAVFMPHTEVNGRLYSQTFRASARYPEQFAGPPFNNVPFRNGSFNIDLRLIGDCIRGGRPLVDVGFLVRELNEFGLNPPEQFPNSTRLVMIGTKMDPMLPATREERRVLTDKFGSRGEFLRMIYENTFIPILSGWKLPDIVDGALIDQTSIATALEVEGNRFGREINVLALTNVPEDEQVEVKPRVVDLIAKLTSFYDPGLAELIKLKYLRESVERKDHWERHYGRTNLCMIAPPKGIRSISPLEKNKDIIRAAGDRAVGPVLDAFGITNEYQEVRNALIELMPFPKSPKVAK